MFCASSLKPGGALLELNQRLEVGEATDLKEEGNRTEGNVLAFQEVAALCSECIYTAR